MSRTKACRDEKQKFLSLLHGCVSIFWCLLQYNITTDLMGVKSLVYDTKFNEFGGNFIRLLKINIANLIWVIYHRNDLIKNKKISRIFVSGKNFSVQWFKATETKLIWIFVENRENYEKSFNN